MPAPAAWSNHPRPKRLQNPPGPGGKKGRRRHGSAAGRRMVQLHTECRNRGNGTVFASSFCLRRIYLCEAGNGANPWRTHAGNPAGGGDAGTTEGGACTETPGRPVGDSRRLTPVHRTRLTGRRRTCTTRSPRGRRRPGDGRGRPGESRDDISIGWSREAKTKAEGRS